MVTEAIGQTGRTEIIISRPNNAVVTATTTGIFLATSWVCMKALLYKEKRQILGFIGFTALNLYMAKVYSETMLVSPLQQAQEDNLTNEIHHQAVLKKLKAGSKEGIVVARAVAIRNRQNLELVLREQGINIAGLDYALGKAIPTPVTIGEASPT